MNPAILQEMLDCYEARENGDTTAPTKHERLNALMLAHPEERRAFLREVMDEALLEDELRVQQVQSIYDAGGAVSRSTESDHREKGHRVPLAAKVTWLYSSAAAAVLIIVAVLVFQVNRGGRSGAQVESATSDVGKATSLAEVVTASGDAAWGSTLIDGTLSAHTSYSLEAGSAHLQLANGVQLSLVAPAEFEIQDAFLVHLLRGKVRAHVPESGHGFRIHTPDIEIKDLGTEFGVEVAEGVDTRVHVFHGEIELHSQLHAQPLLATDGYAAKWVRGESEVISASTAPTFPTRRSIAYENWNSHHQHQLQDPDLAMYLDFRKGSEVLPCLQHEQNATTQRALKVRGRWAKNSAYLIDYMEQAIKLPDLVIEADFTLQAWIYPEDLDHSYSVIMNTHRFERNRFHWQIARDGEVTAGYHDHRKYRKKHASTRVTQGQWNHVAVTYQSTTQTLSTYVNGSLTATSWRQSTPLDLSETYIGGWNAKGHHGQRLLNGKIDEFSLHRRALTSAEVYQEYQVGKR